MMRWPALFPAAACSVAALCLAMLPSTDSAAQIIQGAARVGAEVTAGGWGTAREVPGTAALNKGGSASIYSVSCTSSGSCSSGG